MRRYRPDQLEDRVSAVISRKIGDRLPRLNWQFDAAIARLRFKVLGKSLAIEPDAQPVAGSRGKRKAAAAALARTFADNVDAFALITKTSPRTRKFPTGGAASRIRHARHLDTGSSPKSSTPLSLRCGNYPRLSHRYYALKARWLGQKRLPLWDRNAPMPRVAGPQLSWKEARDTVITAYGGFRRMADIAERFSPSWIDALVRAASLRARFRIRPCRRRILTCCGLP